MNLNRWNLAVAGLAASWGFVSLWSYAIVGFLVLPFALAGGRFLPDGPEWAYVIALGALPTAASGVLYMRALKDVTAQAAGLLAHLDPVSASFLAWAILREVPEPSPEARAV